MTVCYHCLLVFLKRSIVEQFLDQVNVSKKHPSTAIALQTKCVQCISGDIIVTKDQPKYLNSNKH